MQVSKVIAASLAGLGLAAADSAVAHTFYPWDPLPIANGTGEIFGWGRMAVGGEQINSGGPRVYIIDGGVGYHQDLPTMRRENWAGGPLVNCYAHATHVAGIIGARIANGGVAGVAAGANMISVAPVTSVKPGASCGNDSLDGTAMTLASVDQALSMIQSEIANQGNMNTAVINISLNSAPIWGASSIREKLRTISTRTQTYAGALIVQAAGNDGQDAKACDVAYAPPGTTPDAHPYDGIMVVGAIKARRAGDDASNWLGQFLPIGSGQATQGGSNYGRCVDIWAPGHEIYSTWNGYDGFVGDQSTDPNQPSPLESIGRLTGTSMAAPHVSGIAARILATPGNEGMDPKELEAVIRGAALAINDPKVTIVARMPFDPANPLLRQRDPDNDGAPSWIEYLVGTTNPGLKDNNIFSSPFANNLYVRQQYRDFLDREHDTGGIDHWTNQLNAGVLQS